MPARSNPLKRRISLNNLAWLGLIAGSAAFIFLVRFPVNSSKLALLTLAVAGLAWISLVILTRKFRTVCSLLVVVPMVAAAIISYAPNRQINEETLRAKYVDNLQSYGGCDYYWGGETSSGIDCSGLPRKAYRMAMLEEGLIRANPALIRHAFLQWQNDASAKAMRDGYREYLVPLGVTGVLKEIPTNKLLPGDLAITTSGRHVIVYMGEDQWIQADPSVMKVHTLNAKKDSNVWFDAEISMFRWSEFPSAGKAK